MAQARTTDDGAGHPPPLAQVTIDDRERGCETATALASMPGAHCAFRRLKRGDYLVDNRLLVERKTLVDLIASIQDGRLFRQAYALATSGYRPLLILEGPATTIAAREMRREAIQGALITVSLVWGVPLLRALDGAESARLMLCAAHQLRRAAAGIVFRPGGRPRGKRHAQLRLLQSLPGIGPARAQRLLEQFGTVAAVIAATPEELATVAGIGDGTVAGIHWAVHEEAAPYTTTGATAPGN